MSQVTMPLPRVEVAGCAHRAPFKKSSSFRKKPFFALVLLAARGVETDAGSASSAASVELAYFFLYAAGVSFNAPPAHMPRRVILHHNFTQYGHRLGKTDNAYSASF